MKKGPQQGATTIYFLLFTLALFGLLTMAVDYGRFNAIQAELQAAADAAALAAATQLAGTTSSTNLADIQWNATLDSTTGNDNRFNLRLNQFGSGNLISQVSVAYFNTLTDASANAGGGVTGGLVDWTSGTYPAYAKAQISAQSPTLFAPFLTLTPGLLPTITVSATAGISAPLCTVSGIDDLAIVDPSASSDPVNFGLIPGNTYTLSLSSSQTPLAPTNCGSTSPSTCTPFPGVSTTGVVPYVMLDHYPNGLQSGTVDDLLFELAAGGISNSPPSVPPSSSITINNIEVDYNPKTPGASDNGAGTTVLTDTTTTEGQDILCGLNLRFGIDPSTYPTQCTTGNSVDFEGLATLLPGAADTDNGTVASGVLGGSPPMQDFATDYCQEGACNFRRVLTVTVVDTSATLNILNFREFLLEPSPVSTADTTAVGVDPSVTNGSFAAQYIGTLVPVRSGTFTGCSNMTTPGVGKVVLH